MGGGDSLVIQAARDLPLDGARVVVAGLGASGRAALDVLATSSGARELLGLDASEAAVETARSSGEVPGSVRLQAEADGTQLADRIVAQAPDVLVISPGFPATGPLHRCAAAAGLQVWSEIELAWRLQALRPDGSRAPWLTLTGTNGKTTTVQMLSSILTAAGERAPAVGNIGEPAVRVAASGAVDALAVELSSFQLHATHSVAAQASACLNLADDHLDWHGGFAEYRAAKARVYERTSEACIYNEDAPVTREMVENADVAEGCRAIGTTLGVPQVGQLGLVGDVLCERAFGASLRERQRGAVELADAADLAHLAPGDAVAAPAHVLANALSAAALARAHGVPAEAVRAGLRGMQPGEHRIATVATVAGVTYVDDTKATNAHAAAASLGALPDGSVVWIAGGLAKGARFDDLVAAHRHKLRAVVLIGLDRAPLREALARHAADVPVVEIDARQDEVMSQAVAQAARLAQPSDTVLLAPASASMDQFRNYAARGEAFAAAVRARQEVR